MAQCISVWRGNLHHAGVNLPHFGPTLALAGGDVDVLATRVTDLRETQRGLAGKSSGALFVIRIYTGAADNLRTRAISLAHPNPFASVGGH
jgi:hypothetical protein